MFICLIFCLFVSLFFCLFIYLFIYLFTNTFARIIPTSTDLVPNYDLSSEKKGMILEFMIVQVWELQ